MFFAYLVTFRHFEVGETAGWDVARRKKKLPEHEIEVLHARHLEDLQVQGFCLRLLVCDNGSWQ